MNICFIGHRKIGFGPIGDRLKEEQKQVYYDNLDKQLKELLKKKPGE